MKTYGLLILIIALFTIESCSRQSSETKPIRKDLTEMVFASGVLQADDQSNLTAQTDGYLRKLDFKEGDIVQAGKLLAVIDNNQNVINAASANELHAIAQENTLPTAPALQQINANIEAANAKYKLDQLQAERYKRLYENNSVSRLEYENAQLAATNSKTTMDALQQQYNNQQISARQQEVSQRNVSSINKVVSEQNQVKAIVNGKIYEKKKQLGDYVRKGDVIAVIGNPNLIYAQLNVDETNMARLQVGLATIVQLNTNKNKTYKATIHEILPSFDANSQSFLVKAYFTDSLDFKIIGTQLEANIIVGEKKNALVVPRAFLDYGNKITLKKDKQIITVKTGVVSNDWAEILSGLNENDVIVMENK